MSLLVSLLINRLKKKLIILSLLIIFTPITAAYAKNEINVHVSILPVKYFVDKIGSGHVVTHLLLEPGENPTTYTPSPNQIKSLRAADLFFRIGIPFENAIIKHIKSISKSTIVDLRKGIKLRKIESHSDHLPDENNKHIDNNPAGEDPPDNNPSVKILSGKYPHDENYLGLDPHIWMDPENVKVIAKTIFQTLVSINPENQIIYQKKYHQFVRELEDLDQYLKLTLKQFLGENLFVFHPSFGYFTDAYGLNQLAIETMGKAPRGKTLANLIKLAKKEQTKILFVQPQFDRNTANKIALNIGGSVVSIDPLAYNYLQSMKTIGETIGAILTQK